MEKKFREMLMMVRTIRERKKDLEVGTEEYRRICFAERQLCNEVRNMRI